LIGKQVAVINYGMGNLLSISHALDAVGVNSVITNNPEEIAKAPAVVVPGVGEFGRAMQNLKARHIDEALAQIIKRGIPYLGICLGLQILFQGSDESPDAKGLGVVPGHIRLLPDARGIFKVPHMGWNTLRIVRDVPLLRGIKNGSYFYFVHSYYVEPDNSEATSAITNHLIEFTSVISNENIMGCQFHPEKSQANGLALLANFKKIISV